MNSFNLVGRIEMLPVLKETSTGLKTCELRLNVLRNFANSEGIYESDEIVVEVWRGLSETVCASCKEGDWIGVNGRIATRRYQKDDKVYLNYAFIAEKIDFFK